MKTKLPRIWLGVIILTLLIVFIIAKLIFGEIEENSTPPLIFPFDDTHATYVITKDPTNNLYQIVYDTTKDKEKLDTCDEPIGGIARCWVEGDFHQEVAIASSNVDLNMFLGKHVIVTGEFIYTEEQCIMKSCVSLGSEKGALIIDTIHEKTEAK